MAGKIKVDPAAILATAQGFDTQAAALGDADTQNKTAQNQLGGWEGKAKDAAVKRFGDINACMTEIMQGIKDQSYNLVAAKETMTDADEAATQALTAR